MITFTSRGDWSKTSSYLKKLQTLRIQPILERYGALGVVALQEATPKRSGETAASWGYEIEVTNEGVTLIWTNSHMHEGTNVAILLQYGHGTGTGGYVQGRDYINPALKPIFDSIADNVWKAVTSA